MDNCRGFKPKRLEFDQTTARTLSRGFNPRTDRIISPDFNAKLDSKRFAKGIDVLIAVASGAIDSMHPMVHEAYKDLKKLGVLPLAELKALGEDGVEKNIFKKEDLALLAKPLFGLMPDEDKIAAGYVPCDFLKYCYTLSQSLPLSNISSWDDIKTAKNILGVSIRRGNKADMYDKVFGEGIDCDDLWKSCASQSSDPEDFKAKLKAELKRHITVLYRDKAKDFDLKLHPKSMHYDKFVELVGLPNLMEADCREFLDLGYGKDKLVKYGINGKPIEVIANEQSFFDELREEILNPVKSWKDKLSLGKFFRRRDK